MTSSTEAVPVGPETNTTVIPNWVAPITTSTAISTVARETLDGTSDTFERQLVFAALNEPCRVTYGTDRLGGQLLTALPYGSGILLVVVWGRGPIQAIRDMRIDNVTPPASVIVTNYLGTTSQTVDAKLVSAFAAMGITHTDALVGLSYSVLELQPGADAGDVTATIDGRLIYDARDGTQTLGTPSTYKWSDVPAAALADIIADTTYGWGRSRDVTSTNAVANANDAMVSGERKRIIGITLDSRKKAEEWVEILRAHAGCYVLHSGATTKFVPDATASSVKTYSKANQNIIKGSVQWSIKDVEQQPNVVQVTYTDTSAVPWKTATAMYPTNGLPPSGQELRLSRLSLTGCQRYSQAMREAIETINHAGLEALVQSWDTYAESVAVEPGDVVTFDDGGLSGGITMRLLARSWVSKGRWKLACQKYDPAAFDSSAVAAPSSGNTTLPSAGNPPTMGAITTSETVITTAAGALPQSMINVSWSSVSWPFVRDYHVQILDASGVLVDEVYTKSTTFQSKPLYALRTYTVRVFVRSTTGVEGTKAEQFITLDATSTATLVSVWSGAVSRSGWTLTNCQMYSLWPGDTVPRLCTNLDTMQGTYNGAAMTNGHNGTGASAVSMLRDATLPTGTGNLSEAISPIYDVGAQRTGVFSAAIDATAVNTAYVYPFTTSQVAATLGMELATAPGGPWVAAVSLAQLSTARYMRLHVTGQTIV